MRRMRDGYRREKDAAGAVYSKRMIRFGLAALQGWFSARLVVHDLRNYLVRRLSSTRPPEAESLGMTMLSHPHLRERDIHFTAHVNRVSFLVSRSV